MSDWTALRNLKDHPTETGIFLDLDGTLAELVDVPEAVHLPDQTRAHLQSLGSRFLAVVVISGRAATSIQDIVGLPDLIYVGNHGLEVIEDGQHRIWLPKAEAIRMVAMEDPLRGALQLEGVRLELKGLSHAIHYRRASDPQTTRLRILEALEGLDLEGVHLREGKYLVQIRPETSLDKGAAVVRLVGERSIGRVLYAGDDTTDIDAFHAIGRLREDGDLEGYRIAVAYPDTPADLLSTSDLRAEGIEEIQDLLDWLAEGT